MIQPVHLLPRRPHVWLPAKSDPQLNAFSGTDAYCQPQAEQRSTLFREASKSVQPCTKLVNSSDSVLELQQYIGMSIYRNTDSHNMI